jgi:hypothetical protein
MTPLEIGVQAGDVLLYRAKGLYGRLIAVKTWHDISHVEIYVGGFQSVASRDGQGTGLYPWRNTELALICRPPASFSLSKAMHWFLKSPHRPYGWLDLLQFVGLNVETRGIVCSPFATEFSRAGDLDPFNGEPADKIAPFQFETSPVYRVSQPKGW